MFPERNAVKARRNLHPFGQKVIIHDYKPINKLSPRSITGRLVRYTNTFGAYWARTDSEKRIITKNPRIAEE